MGASGGGGEVFVIVGVGTTTVFVGVRVMVGVIKGSIVEVMVGVVVTVLVGGAPAAGTIHASFTMVRCELEDMVKGVIFKPKYVNKGV